MGDWTLPQLCLAGFVGTFCFAAAIADFRTHRIPNKLTVPMFLLGWVFQASFAGWTGIGDAAMAFGLGFGILFLLWLMGSGGGGDVKLMGALSVWLGLRMTILVLLFSTVLVLIGTVIMVIGTVFIRGFTRKTEPVPAVAETTERSQPSGNGRNRRRVMAYAIPVAFATWTILAFELPSF